MLLKNYDFFPLSGNFWIFSFCICNLAINFYMINEILSNAPLISTCLNYEYLIKQISTCIVNPVGMPFTWFIYRQKENVRKKISCTRNRIHPHTPLFVSRGEEQRVIPYNDALRKFNRTFGKTKSTWWNEKQCRSAHYKAKTIFIKL